MCLSSHNALSGLGSCWREPPGATLRLPLAIESRAFGAQEAEYTNNT